MKKILFGILLFVSVCNLAGCGENSKANSKTFYGSHGFQITLTEEFSGKNGDLDEKIEIETNNYCFTASQEMALESENISFVSLRFEFNYLPDDLQEIGVEAITEEWFAEIYTAGQPAQIVDDTENGLVYFRMGYATFARVLKSDDAFWLCEFEGKDFGDLNSFLETYIPWVKTIVIQ